MKLYQEKIVQELKELSAKVDRLAEFLKTDVFNQLPSVDQELMHRQYRVMTGYAAILTERIARF